MKAYMQKARTAVLLALTLIVTWGVLPAPALGSPAAEVAPEDTALLVNVGPETCGKLLQAAALAPLAKMFSPKLNSPFAHLNMVLELPPGTMEQAAPHLQNMAFIAPAAMDEGRPFMRNPQNYVTLVFTFDDARWPAALMQGAEKNEDGLFETGEIEALWVVRDKHLMMCISPDGARYYSAADYATLDGVAGYRKALKAAGDSPIWAWAPLSSIREALLSAAPEEEGKAIEQAINTLGLQHLQGALLTSHSTPKSMELRLTLTTDGAREGMLGALPKGGMKMARDVPANVTGGVAYNWGEPGETFGAMIELMLQLERQFSPNNPNMAYGLASVAQMLGVESMDQFFGRLGTGMAAYLLPPGPDGMLSRDDWVAVLEVRDEAGFRASLDSISKNLTGQPLPTVQEEGMEFIKAPSPPQMPVLMALQQKRLVIGSNPAKIKGHLEWLQDGGRETMSVAPGDAWERGMLDLGLLLTSYPEPKSGPVVNWRAFRDGDDLVATLSIDSDEELPALTRLAPLAVPVSAAMLMPALSRARGEARKAADKANLHNIGIGLMMYREDKGDYPPNLKALLDENYIDAEELFVSPADQNPPVVDGLPTSYVYIGTPLPDNLPAQVPLVYTRRGVFGPERNVLFVDIAVMGIRGNRFGRIRAQEAYDKVVEKLGDKATDERKKELQKFFGLD